MAKLRKQLETTRKKIKQMISQLKNQEAHVAVGSPKGFAIEYTEAYIAALKKLSRDIKRTLDE